MHCIEGSVLGLALTKKSRGGGRRPRPNLAENRAETQPLHDIEGAEDMEENEVDEEEQGDLEIELEAQDVSRNEELLLRAEALQQLFLESQIVSAVASEDSSKSVPEENAMEVPAERQIVMPPEQPNAENPPIDTEVGAAIVAPRRPEQPVVPRVPGIRGIMGTAEATCYVAGGKISFYNSKGAFKASCNNPSHSGASACILTRTNRGRLKRGVESNVGGRPLGMLALWLARGAACASKADHVDKSLLQSLNHEERLACQGISLVHYIRCRACKV